MRRQFVVVIVALLGAFVSACTTNNVGGVSVVSPTPDTSGQGLQLVSNVFIPDSGATLHAQDVWAMRQTSWCPVGMMVGPVFVRDDQQILVGSTTKACDGGPSYMNFQITGVVDQRIMSFATGHKVFVKVATANNPADWQRGQVNFLDVPDAYWSIQ